MMNAPSTLPISETFFSVQGEGKLAGVPSFFIRTSGCNLRCTWCDTPYASWNPERSIRSIDELLDEVAASGTRHAVLTGGEPMMFPSLEKLTHALRERHIHITIETAGTISREVSCDLMSISPKLSNSTPAKDDPRDPGGSLRVMHEQRRINIPVLQQLLDRTPEFQLKFVVSGPAELSEIEELLGLLRGWKPADVLLMPEGVTLPSQSTKHWVVAECMKRGFRYCPRLHLDLFGHTRGT
jgi:7-carboxy-7-deazaguanine synthase